MYLAVEIPIVLSTGFLLYSTLNLRYAFSVNKYKRTLCTLCSVDNMFDGPRKFKEITSLIWSNLVFSFGYRKH